MALAGLNHILSLAMRTPASGALGGVPVTEAIPLVDVRRRQRGPVGDSDFRRRDAGDFFQRGQCFAHRPIALRVAKDVAFAKTSLFRRENVPDRHVADMDPVQSRVEIRRQFAIQKIHNDLAGRRRFHIVRTDGCGGIDDDDRQTFARQLGPPLLPPAISSVCNDWSIALPGPSRIRPPERRRHCTNCVNPMHPTVLV